MGMCFIYVLFSSVNSLDFLFVLPTNIKTYNRRCRHSFQSSHATLPKQHCWQQRWCSRKTFVKNFKNIESLVLQVFNNFQILEPTNQTASFDVIQCVRSTANRFKLEQTSQLFGP